MRFKSYLPLQFVQAFVACATTTPSAVGCKSDCSSLLQRKRPVNVILCSGSPFSAVRFVEQELRKMAVFRGFLGKQGREFSALQTGWRRERDSNPRYGFPYSGFQDRLFQPLTHPSAPFKYVINCQKWTLPGRGTAFRPGPCHWRERMGFRSQVLLLH